jgi:hypothetical protein
MKIETLNKLPFWLDPIWSFWFRLKARFRPPTEEDEACKAAIRLRRR